MRHPCPTCKAPLVLEIDSLLAGITSAVFTGLPVEQAKTVGASCNQCGLSVTGYFGIKLAAYTRVESSQG